MNGPPVKVAVVGHTNTGKTSLMRTLLRDVQFGDVSDHPATTRHVEGSAILVAGEPLIELYDTPGLEDSIGLLEHLDGLGRDDPQRGRRDWIDVIEGFLGSTEAHGRFAQEAKAIRQVLRSDLALYVIDARDRVLGKHRDELEILGRCARPIVPVLNFTAGADAQTPVWREHLSRVNMHAVAEFDTVVFDEDGERRLFEKMGTLLDKRRGVFERLIADRREGRRRLVRAAARLLADMLIDVAAFVVIVPAEGEGEGEAEAARAIDSMKAAVREREERCLGQLLELFQFRPGDGRLGDLPLEGGRWGLDLFSPAAMKQFSVRAGGAAAAGAVAGLALDAMTIGASFGLFAVTGAAVGTLLETGALIRPARLLDRARGYRELRCDDATLRLLMARQVALAAALLHRGHAAMEPVVVRADRGKPARPAAAPRLPDELLRARANPHWSSLAAAWGGGTGAGAGGGAGAGRAGAQGGETGPAAGRTLPSPARATATAELAASLEAALTARP